MREYSPEEKRAMLEYIESCGCDDDRFVEYYIEEKRREFNEEWYDYLEEFGEG